MLLLSSLFSSFFMLRERLQFQDLDATPDNQASPNPSYIINLSPTVVYINIIVLRHFIILYLRCIPAKPASNQLISWTGTSDQPKWRRDTRFFPPTWLALSLTGIVCMQFSKWFSDTECPNDIGRRGDV